MKKQFNNFVEVERMLQFLDIQEVTTERQENNGTREFKLPINDPYGNAIHVASYSTGYVRRTKTSGRSDWQLNKTRKVPPTKNYKWESIERILIPNEQDRIEYLIAFCLKNYYIGQANMLSSGKFIPKWKYENEIKTRDSIADVVFPEKTQSVQVIIDGQRYNII
jgi:hypothetical protein